MFGWITSIVSWIWDGFQAISDAVVTGLVIAYHFLSSFASAIWDAAKWSYQNILKPVGEFLDKAYQRFKDLYEQYVVPIQAKLDRIVAGLRKIYNTYVQPLLSTIDGLRKVLELLKLLHVQFAAQLDAELGALEQKIAGPLLLAIQVINRIDSTISQYILTIDNLFQRVTMLNTIRRDLAPLGNIQWNSMLRNTVARGQAGVTPPATLTTMNDQLDLLDNVVAETDDNQTIDLSAADALLDELMAV